MSRNEQQRLLHSLCECWQEMSNDEQSDLLSHARWLAYHSKFRGGPFDGLRVDDRFRDSSSVCIQFDQKRVAVYELDDNSGSLIFRCIQTFGGEGGCWPDVRLADLREMGVNDVDGAREFGDRVLNIGRHHFAVDDAVGAYWFVGENLFSGWMHEGAIAWRQSANVLFGFSPRASSDADHFEAACRCLCEGGPNNANPC
ncbi:hypothetical protein CA13_05210 [Planctomycetes bacterium CA13]|uniref:Uncharacterized protein n=1 Tax=Novipirellula herctigrandis TaxID=2527986 RepID=A0A5C5YX42_9BACT|nr:hypothetical protein CA13_05210 [Planctomycetes bacterium CA13]